MISIIFVGFLTYFLSFHAKLKIRTATIIAPTTPQNPVIFTSSERLVG